jgi:hypothetical protein
MGQTTICMGLDRHLEQRRVQVTRAHDNQAVAPILPIVLSLHNHENREASRKALLSYRRSVIPA